MKVFSTALCFGLLALLSGMNLLQSVHGRPHLISGHELFPAKEVTSHKKLLVPLPNRNPGFQRPSHTGIDLPSRLEEHRQLKKLKGRFKEAKTAQLSSAVQDLSSSHPNKRACFWKYCV